MRHLRVSTFAVLAALVTASATPAAAPRAPAVISDLDLSGPFATRSPWRFIATQGAEIEDPVFGAPETAPGPIQLCLRAGPSATCNSVLQSAWPAVPPASDIYADLHYLNAVEIVRPQGAAGRPLLWVQASSLHSVDGGHIMSTQVLAYRPSRDRFVRVYEGRTGSNHNEETRFIAGGPLKGDIISVEPTDNAPFGYWVSVSALKPADAYRRVLRYRSATHYNDGNPLAVIDSEMPNIQRRLGLWKPGQPIPTPALNGGGKPCPKPTLRHTELWCG